MAVAALPANQQANFSQLHLRDAALQFFQTLPLAIRQNVELSITALQDRFCNPQIPELHVLKLENKKSDSNADMPENFLGTLEIKVTEAYPDTDPQAVAPIDPHAADAVVERTRFDQETAHCSEIMSIHNLCKTDDSVMDAFSEMGPSVTDTLVTALTKLSTS